MNKADSNWTVYILRCADDTLYTGITTDIKRRLYEHNNDNSKAAQYTKSRRPVNLVFQETFPNRSLASQREYQIKKFSRTQKFELINYP